MPTPLTSSSTASWVLLVVAGLLEVGWAVGLRVSQGFTRPAASAVTVLLMLASFVVLSRALREIPVGTGYAVWTGIGAAGTAVVGLVKFGESASPGRLLFLAMIVCGTIGLKLLSR